MTLSRLHQHRQRVLHMLLIKEVAPKATASEFPQRSLSRRRLPLKVEVAKLRMCIGTQNYEVYMNMEQAYV